MRPCLLAGAASCLLGPVAAAGIQQVARVQVPSGPDGRHWTRATAKNTTTSAVLNPLRVGRDRGEAVKPGTELRILCVGDSITVGTFSDADGGDGNGYRLQLRDDLSADTIRYAGTVTSPVGNMTNGNFAAWAGKTIEYISDNMAPSLLERPNVVLVHAGTNDMNPDHSISTEGNDPVQAAARLGKLVDRIVGLCPDAVVLVAMIINTCSPGQDAATREFQRLTPGVVQSRFDAGHHVLAANLTSFPTTQLRDCIHPTNEGYRLLGDYWYDLVRQIPRDWIQTPASSPEKPGKSPRPSPADEVSQAASRRNVMSLQALVASLAGALAILA